MGDVKRFPDLPATAYAVLGILSFGASLSGYELRQWARSSLGPFYWTPAQSQVYRELQRLEVQGLVEHEAVAQEARPDKVEYRITEAGRAALAAWVAEADVAAPVLKHHLALRVYLSGTGDSAPLVAMLETHRDRLLATLDSLENDSVALGGEADTRRAALVAEWAADIHRGDLRGTERLLKTLTVEAEAEG